MEIVIYFIIGFILAVITASDLGGGAAFVFLFWPIIFPVWFLYNFFEWISRK